MDARKTLLLLPLALVACGGPLKTLTPRASFDMNCPAEQLTATKLAANTYGVTGCGRRTTYLLVGEYGHRKWVANTASVDGPQARVE